MINMDSLLSALLPAVNFKNILVGNSARSVKKTFVVKRLKNRKIFSETEKVFNEYKLARSFCALLRLKVRKKL